MAVESEIIAFVTNQIGQIIIIILAIVAGFRWLDKRNEQRVIESEIRLLGEQRDGKGGIIGTLLNQHAAHSDKVNRNIKYIRERMLLLVKFLAGDVRRLDVTMEKIAQKSGVYYTRSQHDYAKADLNVGVDEERRFNEDNDNGSMFEE
jgi:hypothetical protein